MDSDPENSYADDNNSDDEIIKVQFRHIRQIIFEAPADGGGTPEVIDWTYNDTIDSRPEQDDTAGESHTTRIR